MPTDPRSDVLNAGLHLAMEFGENWMKPIQSRLHERYPALSEAELNELNQICQDAMRFGHARVYDLAAKSGDKTKFAAFKPLMMAKYAWVNGHNLSRLFSQGMYYAWKDLGF